MGGGLRYNVSSVSPKVAIAALQSIKTRNELHHNAAFNSDVTHYDVL